MAANATQLSNTKLTTKKLQQLNEQRKSSFQGSPPPTNKKPSVLNAFAICGGGAPKQEDERRDSKLPLITDPHSS